jgi:hypothetical protein
MIAYSFREVRPAIDRGFNEVDEVDRPQPGGAGCGSSPNLRRRCAWRTTIAAQLFAVIGRSNLTG